MSNIGTAATGKVLQGGGTGSSPTFSTATFPATATGTGTLLRADGTNWVATTSTYPNTNAVSTLLYASSANVMAALATGNNGVLITSAGGVPSISSTLPSAVQGNITSTGTITSGTWNGTAIDVAYGGTGRTTLTNHGVLVGAATTAITQLAAGSAGQVLQSGGASADPVYSTATYPATAGTSGNFIKSDGTNFSSAALPASSSDALATMNTTVNNVTGDSTVYEPIIFDTATFDVGSNYSVSTGLFTAPSTGKYLVTVAITFSGIGVAHTSGEVRVYLNGATYTRSSFNPAVNAVGGLFTFCTSIIIPVSATGTIGIAGIVNGSTKTVGIQGDNFGKYSWMSVTLLGS